MKSSFRWYGDSDPVTLDKIRQIPGMRSIVSAVYDVKPGEVCGMDRGSCCLYPTRAETAPR